MLTRVALRLATLTAPGASPAGRDHEPISRRRRTSPSPPQIWRRPSDTRHSVGWRAEVIVVVISIGPPRRPLVLTFRSEIAACDLPGAAGQPAPLSAASTTIPPIRFGHPFDGRLLTRLLRCVGNFLLDR